jgi:hypothetical protein
VHTGQRDRKRHTRRRRVKKCLKVHQDADCVERGGIRRFGRCVGLQLGRVRCA